MSMNRDNSYFCHIFSLGGLPKAARGYEQPAIAKLIPPDPFEIGQGAFI